MRNVLPQGWNARDRAPSLVSTEQITDATLGLYSSPTLTGYGAKPVQNGVPKRVHKGQGPKLPIARKQHHAEVVIPLTLVQ